MALVTGKGGTGKSTLAAALGRLSAERGRRAIVVEIDAFHSAMPGLLGRTPKYAPRPVAPRLDVCNISWEDALEEWLEHTLHVQRLVKLILRNRMVSLFLDATPGVREIVVLSRVATLCEQYDQVIVDLPASGHAVALLQVPWVATDLLRTGPIRERALHIIELLARPDTRPAIVSLPEEMVVNETIELRDRLAAAAPVLARPVLLLNRASAPSLSQDERALLRRLSERVPITAPAAELLRAGRWEVDLEGATALALTRLAELDLPLVQFPRLGSLGGLQGGPEAIVRQMCRALARQVVGEPVAALELGEPEGTP